MTRHDIVALMPGAGPPEAPRGCSLVTADGHVAVLCRAPLFPPSRRAELVKASTDRAQLLEALLPHGTVLPALPRQRLDAREVASFVRANSPLLQQLVTRFAERVQFQVTVRWAAEQAGAAFGVADEAALTAVATALRARIGERLAATGAELAPLPVAGDILSNSAVLIPRSAEPVLDGAVSDIDAIWTEGFSVRVIGPYPAVSFASFGIDRADRATVRDAMSAFGLPRGFTEEDLKVARRALLMRAEADRREALVRQAEILACVARLGSAQAPVLVARVWSEGTSSSASKEVRAA